VAFADASDGRITRHLTERFDTVGQQQSALSTSGGRERSFSPGMAATYNNNLELGRKIHFAMPPYWAFRVANNSATRSKAASGRTVVSRGT
jgi:hypothetical protein